MKRWPSFVLWVTFSLLSLNAFAVVTRLEPARVFDGENLHDNWIVLVEDDTVLYVGVDNGAPGLPVGTTIALRGQTLMPGLIEGHAHVLLHPYNETPWNDQVLKESEAERVVRAVNHVRDSLLSGVTTIRDLGTEGAGFADIGIRDSIQKGIIPGPRLIVSGRAIVATGSYGPKGFHERVDVPLGAQSADGYDDLVRVLREQIGRDVDFIKVYADYRWGPQGEAAPTFTQAELETIVEVTRSSGRYVAAHASTDEAIRRAVMAGVETIEHGNDATAATFELMREHQVALCPTLAAGYAISQYNGWNKDSEPEPESIRNKRVSFQAALQSGVTICFGGDVGVYTHGDNVRELEMMVEYGMDVKQALKSATSVNADIFHIADRVGRISAGLLADIIAVNGNPLENISALRDIRLVMKNGVIYKDSEKHSARKE